MEPHISGFWRPARSAQSQGQMSGGLPLGPHECPESSRGDPLALPKVAPGGPRSELRRPWRRTPEGQAASALRPRQAARLRLAFFAAVRGLPPRQTQVLPDWRSSLPIAKALCDDQGVAQEPGDRLRSQLVGEVLAETGAMFKPEGFKEPMLPNKYFLMALDNSLRMGAGLKLADFQEELTCRPLLPTEVRMRVRLPDARKIEGSAAHRAIIVGKVAGAARVELPRRRLEDATIAFRRVLHKTQDEGSIGLPASFLLDQLARSTTVEDPWHRCFNDLKDSVASSGARLVVLEHTVVFNSPTGPWGSHAFSGQIRGAAQEFLSCHDHRCELYRFFYAGIAKDLGMGVLDMGSDSHMAETWARAKASACFLCKGDRVKLGRWQSWFNVAKKWRPFRTAYTMVLCWVG